MRWDYECQKCEHVFELEFNNSDERDLEAPKVECPECQSTEKIQLVSKSGGFQLNGDGWCKKHYGR